MSKLFNDNGNYTKEVVDSGEIWEGEIKWSDWEKKYKPIKNHLDKYSLPEMPSLMFETYGEEYDYVKSIPNERVWTFVDGDMSSLIVTGLHWVNRIGYYITEEPWTDPNETVLLSVEVECECYDEERFDYGGDPDCDICEGNGLRTEYLD